MNAFCQRCSDKRYDWTVKQAEFMVGGLKHWKIQLCERCTEHVQDALRIALRPVDPETGAR